MRSWKRAHDSRAAQLSRVLVFSVAISALAACTPQRTAIDPAQCRAILERGGSSQAYTQCLIDQAKDKSVGGMPVLSERARAQIDNRQNDPCLTAPGMSQNDYLACELARPSHPAPAREPMRAGDIVPLPLSVEPSQ
jgi:hypothetical protein